MNPDGPCTFASQYEVDELKKQIETLNLRINMLGKALEEIPNIFSNMKTICETQHERVNAQQKIIQELKATIDEESFREMQKDNPILLRVTELLREKITDGNFNFPVEKL